MAYIPPIGNATLDFESPQTPTNPWEPSGTLLTFGGSPYALDFTEPYIDPVKGSTVVLFFGGVTDVLGIINDDVTLGIQIPHMLIGDSKIIEIDPITLPLNIDEQEVDYIYIINEVQVDLGINIPHLEVDIMPVIVSDTVSLGLLVEQAQIGGGQAYHLPVGISLRGHRMRWGLTDNHQDNHHKAPYGNTEILDEHHQIPWVESDSQDIHSKSPYQGILLYQDEHDKLPWGNVDYWQDPQYQSAYVMTPPFKDHHKQFPWNKAQRYVDPEFQAPFDLPPPKDMHKEIPWGDHIYFPYADKRMPVKASTWLDQHHKALWGPKWYSLFCQAQYFPPVPGTVVKLYFVDGHPGSAFGNPPIDPLNFYQTFSDYCPYKYWHSGPRDVYGLPVVIIKGPDSPEILKVYYMLNIVTVKRLPDDVPIEAYNISIQTDRDSWLWDMTMTVTDRGYLDLVAPSGSTFTNIEVTINGHVWTFMIEGWRESKSFGQGAWDIYGRSPSATLGDPYAAVESYTNTTAKQGIQLITDILQFSGFSATWTPTDFLNPALNWLVPAGAFSYTDGTKIAGVQKVVQSVGSYIQSPPDPVTDPMLYIYPRYKKQPWNWASELEDAVLVHDQFWEVSRAHVSKPLVNSVIVSGLNQGALCDITRGGTAGDFPAPTVTDDLITTEDAGAERGRIVLGNSGNWIHHQVKLFSLLPDPELPGLVLPGTFVRVSENGDWKGQVTGTQINVRASGGRVEVDQSLDIEEYVP